MFFYKFVNSIFCKLLFGRFQKEQKKSKFYYKLSLNILPPIAKSTGKQKFQTQLSLNYNFVFTNLLKMRQTYPPIDIYTVCLGDFDMVNLAMGFWF